MATLVNCPYCGSSHTSKTTNGIISNALAVTGGVVAGAAINLVTGGSPGIFGTNKIIGKTWQQYCCHDCHEAFKVRISGYGGVKEIKKY